MWAYIFKRLALIIPTLFGIVLINFVIVQAAPGGPVERMIAQVQGFGTGATDRFAGGGAQGEIGTQAMMDNAGQAAGAQSKYRGAQGLDPEFIAELEAQYGFDKPVHERFFKMIGDFS